MRFGLQGRNQDAKGLTMAELPSDLSKLKLLADDSPGRHDVFIGLVAPIGSSGSEVLRSLKSELKSYNYEIESVRLADLLDGLPGPSGLLPTRRENNYYKARMDAGDNLRGAAGDWSALAALAVARVADMRNVSRDSLQASQPLAATAYIFDSLKHPREAALLRAVYGNAFWLISIVQEVSERINNVAEELARQDGDFDRAPESRAKELIDRDESDPDAVHGQHVRDVFAAADFFLPVQKGSKWKDEVRRFVQGVFDAPFLTPSEDEEAMRHAQAAALRSSAIGRQVGAVIVPPGGSPFILGTNEVPKPGGGQFREGDNPDHRDFQSGSDPNPAYTQRVIRELIDRLAKAKFFTDARNAAGGDAVLKEAATPGDSGHSVLDGTRAKSLIEFTRCLHAEQAAIVNAARTGVAIEGARLYTTTFPCHECTKFIIGAGIVELQYVEPYPKSLAGDLYIDLIDTVPPMTRRTNERVSEIEKVPFRPFLGFGPARYDEVFTAGTRRSGEGVVEHEPSAASPVGAGWSEIGVRTMESEVSTAIFEVLETLGSALDSEIEEDSVREDLGDPQASERTRGQLTVHEGRVQESSS